MYYGWLVVFLVALYHSAITGLITYSYSMLVVPLIEEFGATLFVAMLGLTVAKLVSACASPFLGSLIDRYPMRIFVTLGIVALGFAFVLLSYISAIWQFLVIFGLFVALALAFLGPLTGATLVSRWFSRRRGLTLGLAAVGMSAGGFVAPPVIQYLMDTMGWRETFFAIGIAVLVSGPAFFLLIRNSPQEHGLLPDGEPVETVSDAKLEEQAEANLYTSTQAILREPAFWMMGVSTGTIYACLTAVLANIVPYALDLGVDKLKAAQLISVMAFTGMIGKLVFGYAADHINLKVSYWLAMALMATGILLLAEHPQYSLMVIASAVIGFSSGGVTPVYGALLAKVFGVASYARVLGLMRVLTMLITLFGPPFAGLVFDLTGTFTLAFYAFVTVLIFAGLVLTPLRLRKTE